MFVGLGRCRRAVGGDVPLERFVPDGSYNKRARFVLKDGAQVWRYVVYIQ